MSRAATFARRPHDCKTDRKQGKKKYSMRLQTKKGFPASQAPQETSKNGMRFFDSDGCAQLESVPTKESKIMADRIKPAKTISSLS